MILLIANAICLNVRVFKIRKRSESLQAFVNTMRQLVKEYPATQIRVRLVGLDIEHSLEMLLAEGLFREDQVSRSRPWLFQDDPLFRPDPQPPVIKGEMLVTVSYRTRTGFTMGISRGPGEASASEPDPALDLSDT